MNPDDNASTHRRWADVAHLAAQGLGACAGCKRAVPLNNALTTRWRNTIVLVVCEDCTTSHDIVMQRTAAGLEIRAEPRRAIVLASTLPTSAPESGPR